MIVENNVGLALEFSDEEVAEAMESIGYRHYKESPENVQKLTAIAMQLNDWQCKAVAAVNNWDHYDFVKEANIMLQADEIPFCEFPDSDWLLSDAEKVGYYMFDNGMAPAELQAAYDAGYVFYLDVEAYGRDLQANDDVNATDDGFLFTGDDTPDTGRYSEKEIDEWIKENA